MNRSPEAESRAPDSVSPQRATRAQITAVDHYERDGVSLLALVNALLRQRRIVVGTVLLVLLVAILFTLFDHSYRASSVFMPESADQGAAGRLAGLAAQLGVIAQGGSDDLEFYAKLPTSRELLRELALSEFHFATGKSPADTLGGNLVQLFEVDGDTPEKRLDKTIAILKKDIAASADLSTGSVILNVNAPWPDLAELMNRRVLNLVSEFNLQKRQSRASAERKFVEGRLSETRRKLEGAESEFATFIEQNRRYQESPRLAATASRLQRRIDVEQQLYASLSTWYENARIEEVRNTPVVTIVDPPERSAHKAGSGLLLNGILAVAVGGLLGVGLALIREAFRHLKESDPSAYAEYLVLRQGMLGRFARERSRSAGQ